MVDVYNDNGTRNVHRLTERLTARVGVGSDIQKLLGSLLQVCQLTRQEGLEYKIL